MALARNTPRTEGEDTVGALACDTADYRAISRPTRELGADRVVDVLREDLQQVVQETTSGRGMDVVVECAGAAASIAGCLKAVKKLGKYIQVGIVGKSISIDYDTILYKQLQVYGSVGHSLSTWDRVARILEQNTIPLERIVTHKFPLSQWKEAFDLCERKQGGKVLLYADE